MLFYVGVCVETCCFYLIYVGLYGFWFGGMWDCDSSVKFEEKIKIIIIF